MSEENQEYIDFVEKFKPKPKLTTDDCYTPPAIYEAIKDYAVERYNLHGARILRPFFRGGDYEKEQYTDDCVVIDNPPFSILSKIIRFYTGRGIRFFLFAPALTNLNMVPAGACLIATGAAITYENGARVSTSFATNLEPETAARTDPMLYRIIKEANKAVQRKQTKKLPKHEYPVEVLTAARMNYISHHGQELTIKREDCTFIRALDQQRELKKGIYGSALLLSERAAAERAAAERAAAERAAAERAAMEDAKAIKYELSERERKIVRELGRK